MAAIIVMGHITVFSCSRTVTTAANAVTTASTDATMATVAVPRWMGQFGSG